METALQSPRTHLQGVFLYFPFLGFLLFILGIASFRMMPFILLYSIITSSCCSSQDSFNQVTHLFILISSVVSHFCCCSPNPAMASIPDLHRRWHPVCWDQTKAKGCLHSESWVLRWELSHTQGCASSKEERNACVKAVPEVSKVRGFGFVLVFTSWFLPHQRVSCQQRSWSVWEPRHRVCLKHRLHSIVWLRDRKLSSSQHHLHLTMGGLECKWSK